MLQDVSQQVGTFRFTKDDVSRILKDVAEFRAPGVYVLKEYVRRKDLEPMQKALTSPKSGTTDLSLQACSTQNLAVCHEVKKHTHDSKSFLLAQ